MKKSNPLREKILEAAVKVLRESGIRKLAQPSVSKEAGIPQGHLTYYFPKRSDLLLAVAEYSIRPIASLLGDSLGEAARAIPAVTTVLMDRHRTRMLLGLAVESDENEELRKRVQGVISGVKELVIKAVGGEGREMQAQVVIAALWGMSIQHYLMEGETSQEETEAALQALLDWAALTPTSAVSKRAGKSTRGTKASPGATAGALRSSKK